MTEKDTTSNAKIVLIEENGFIKYSDGTIVDVKNKLMWMTQDYIAYNGKPLANTSWKVAAEWQNEINKMQYAGYDDWRLPEVSEMTRLVRPKLQRAFCKTLFDKTNAYAFWTNKSITKHVKSYVCHDCAATSVATEGQRNGITGESFKFSVRLVRSVE